MSHFSYIKEEVEEKDKKSRLHWLFFIIIVFLAIIALLIFINLETNFFVKDQEERIDLTPAKKVEIENRLMAGFDKREIPDEDKIEIQERLEDSQSEETSSQLTPEDKSAIESRLKN